MKQLVLLHGWGMTPKVFDTLGARLASSFALHPLALPGYCDTPAVSPDALVSLAESVASRAPQRCCVVGWSLGAQVAIAWARLAPQQVEALALVAATPSFVQRASWPHAMDAAVFETFAENLECDRAATLARFAALQAQGDASMKSALLRLRAALCTESDATASTLRHGLRVLLRADLREALPDVRQDTLLLHGEKDRLVPIAAGEYLAREMPHARLSTIAGAAHAPFLTAPDAVAAALEDFLR